MNEDFPEYGEVVIGKISKVLDYGVFMDLIEYEGLQAFVHISNVSSSWIKNIRNFVKEGQVRAGKVTNVDRQKKQVDVSFTKVSSNQQRAKIEEYKQLKRTQKLIELLANDAKTDFDVAWQEVAEPLIEAHESLYNAFQQILIKGEDAAKAVPKKWVSPLMHMVEKNFEIPVKSVRGKIFLTMPSSVGVDGLKDALISGQKKGGKNIEIHYEGSGNYSVKATSVDYKSAEKILKNVGDEIISFAHKLGGKAEFTKVES
ncbi:MAG TPA: S1 RNA-binding domain-containing protein [archaeon]|nr:S1 RNA-binding domain-containing protein [archaeon]